MASQGYAGGVDSTEVHGNASNGVRRVKMICTALFPAIVAAFTIQESRHAGALAGSINRG